jgi:hypothetical protein
MELGQRRYDKKKVDSKERLLCFFFVVDVDVVVAILSVQKSEQNRICTLAHMIITIKWFDAKTLLLFLELLLDIVIQWL